MVGWFKNIAETISTVFEGMAITFSHFVRKPSTIQYPDRIAVQVQDTLPLRYRGILEVDMDICTNCKACERYCPIACIAIVDSEDPNKKRQITKFDIDIAKCMFCGICSEVCPTGSIRHSQEFEGACYEPAAMVRHFVNDEVAHAPFKPAKKNTTLEDPVLAKRADKGKIYMDEFAQPEK